MKATKILLVLATLVTGCGEASPTSVSNGDTAQAVPGAISNAVTKSKWSGTYVSPREVLDFTWTVLRLTETEDECKFVLEHSSDVVVDEPGTERVVGTTVVTEDAVFVPYATASQRGDSTVAIVQRYRQVNVGGRMLLLNDDAHAAHAKTGRLPAYGVLIRIGAATVEFDEEGEFPSLKGATEKE